MKTLTPQVANEMVKGATFSECRKYRYVLWRIWDESLPAALVIGLNPSTANEDEPDPTIRNLCAMLQASGYGALYMVNLFALVSAEPNDLRSCPDPLKNNDAHITLTARKCEDVIFAWGAFKQAQYRVKKMEQSFPYALCFGRTKHGHPIHPLAASVWMKSKCKLQKFTP